MEKRNIERQYSYRCSTERREKWQFRLAVILLIAAIALVSHMEYQDRVAMGIIKEANDEKK